MKKFWKSVGLVAISATLFSGCSTIESMLAGEELDSVVAVDEAIAALEEYKERLLERAETEEEEDARALMFMEALSKVD